MTDADTSYRVSSIRRHCSDALRPPFARDHLAGDESQVSCHTSEVLHPGPARQSSAFKFHHLRAGERPDVQPVSVNVVDPLSKPTEWFGAHTRRPLFFQAVLLTNATTSGLRLAFPTVVSSLFGAFTGLAITRTRRIKWPVMTGTTLILLGTIALVFMGRHLPDIMYHLVLVPTSIGQGLAFPGTFIALLASSEQAEQAVITSVLMLWRSVGMVLGVALSSLAVQNGLVYYLDKFVAGERREEIIELARSDIEAIVKMPEPYREQVVDSYAAALRVTFTCGAGLALVCVLILVPMRTKGLPSRK